MVWPRFIGPPPALTLGESKTPGTHIVYIDFIAHKVDIQVASADTILIHNGSQAGNTVVGNVTLVW